MFLDTIYKCNFYFKYMILGIECTAHTFGVGIVDKGKILANVKDSYTTEKGGIIPVDAARHHAKVAEGVFQKALKEANVTVNEIKAIAISNAPGLPPCLSEGMKFAKKKARELNLKLIPVNHCIAHLEIARITGAKDPVLLYASGANTQIIAYAEGKYRVFGETLDIGIGNFIDNFARILGLGFPGGPKIEELAKNGNYIELPYKLKGMDVAFSGILTNLKQKYEKVKAGSLSKDNEKYSKEDLSYSLQETVFAMLIEASERALAHIGKKELVIGGGVGCNKRLQEMCEIMCKERGCKFFALPNSLLQDNGAMIAFAGEIMYNSGIVKNIDEVDIDSRQRTDQVEVTWK